MWIVKEAERSEINITFFAELEWKTIPANEGKESSNYKCVIKHRQGYEQLVESLSELSSSHY